MEQPEVTGEEQLTMLQLHFYLPRPPAAETLHALLEPFEGRLDDLLLMDTRLSQPASPASND